LSPPRLAPAHAAASAAAGRHYEHTMDALALRADDGRGTAPICCAEPQAGCEAQISEWGNPLTLCEHGASRGNPAN
jgi:hypothetical protein